MPTYDHPDMYQYCVHQLSPYTNPFFSIYGIQIPTKHLKLTRIHGNIKNSGKILTCIFIFPFFWGGHQLRYLGNLKYQPPNSIQVFIFNNKSLP